MPYKPLKRHKALQPLSRDHHHGLLFTWKIRTGFSKNINPERIWKYALWFYNNHLIPHFELEEQHIFTILGDEDDLVKKTLSQHRHLHRLFANTDNKAISLSKIEKQLDKHIRFEERILFPKIQEKATEAELLGIEKIHHQDPFNDNLDDEFWR